jgi:hypothetical protein
MDRKLRARDELRSGPNPVFPYQSILFRTFSPLEREERFISAPSGIKDKAHRFEAAMPLSLWAESELLLLLG